MVSTITRATASQDLLDVAARLVRLSFVTCNQYYLIDSFFDSFFDLLLLCYIVFL